MTLADGFLFLAIALLALNHALVRLPGWAHRMWLFWVVQLSNLAMACALIVVGIPGLRGQAFYVKWMFSLLFVFHVVTNNRRIIAARRDEKEEATRLASNRADALRKALREGESRRDEESPEESGGEQTKS